MCYLNFDLYCTIEFFAVSNIIKNALGKCMHLSSAFFVMLDTELHAFTVFSQTNYASGMRYCPLIQGY